MELSHAPLTPFMSERLPGMAPLSYADWLHRDEAFAPQMAYRDRLIAEAPGIVLAGEGCAGAEELLSLVLSTLAAHDPGYEIGTDRARRPDGVEVPLDRARPFATLGRLAQEDFLILDRPPDGEEHVLTGAVLCFPSRWSLAEKMNRPLIGIHENVPAYDDGLAPRVQRLFDALAPERPLVRANWLVHPTSELHQPKLFRTKAKTHDYTGRFWLRVERQSILKLAASGVAVFTVKTLVTPVEALDAAQRAGLIAALEGQGEAMREYHGGAAHGAAAVAALRAL
ncbi:MAG: heme-dependent oxidative N-demethylase family protein [Pikeienuella sp.]